MKTVSAKQSGQAVIEYILVLLVVISILLGSMMQFSKGFRKFTDSYFGDYLACLLELGELPALGGSSSGQCVFESPEFKPKSPGDTAGGDGSSGGKKDAGKKDGAPGKFSSSTAGGGGGSGRAGDSNNVFGKGFGTNNREGRPGSVIIGKVKTDSYTGSTEATGGGKNDSANKNASIQVLDQSGGVIDPFEERKVKETQVAIGKDTLQTDLKTKKSKLSIARKVASTDTKTDDTQFGFGDFLKWLLIAAIIVALVVFLGGQALQISKSWE